MPPDGITIERCVIAGARIRSGKEASVVLSVVMPLNSTYGKLAKTLAALIETGAVLNLDVAITEIQQELS